MKQEIAEKWIAKLRSGDVEQCTSYLGKDTAGALLPWCAV